MAERRFPDHFYNWISVGGAFLAVATFVIIALLVLVDAFVHPGTMYLGILTYMILPGFLVLGLVMIALGGFLERRRREQGRGASLPPVLNLDLRDPKHRRAVFVFVTGTAIFLVASSLGTYQAYHISESTKFCGTLCHKVMEPEHTAYLRSAHARVGCVACHIGPGAGWFVKSKMSGAYQVYSTAFNKYSRPIETPIKNLRPARETCLQCHWPEKFFGERKHVNPHYLADEKNTPYPITLLVDVGGTRGPGGGHGIHWHMMIENKVEYIARDHARQDIAWVRVTGSDGKIHEYKSTENPLTDAERAAAEVRTMDCIDCHNRPSHNYRPPAVEVNRAMAQGLIATDLPFIKREAVMALDQEYGDRRVAQEAIAAGLRKFYAENFPALAKDRAADIEKAVAAVGEIYRNNFFPEMKVTWRKYPENIGHSLSVGCFRCHGTSLATAEGKTITKDCSSCHMIMAQGDEPKSGMVSVKGLTFRHPVDIGGMEADGNCAACHQGGAELY
jgi:nitrate/TMAO reductase-like tetraheme cytochrome c subunit